jgi:hypothetical protein
MHDTTRMHGMSMIDWLSHLEASSDLIDSDPNLNL